MCQFPYSGNFHFYARLENLTSVFGESVNSLIRVTSISTKNEKEKNNGKNSVNSLIRVTSISTHYQIGLKITSRRVSIPLFG